MTRHVHPLGEPGHSRHLTDLEDLAINVLHHRFKDLDIKDTVQLPQICVIGDRSTGKSSLIEVISAVRVPQANNLCMQFPLEINLIRTSEHSVDWNCRISIEHSYEFIPADIGEKPTENQPMPPWKQLPKAPTFHVTETHSHNAVCELISEAQTKILAALLSVVVPHKYKIKFSPNAIKLDIIRHDIPDLSFVNLPGVITTNLDESFVGLVENLVTMYAKSPQSINILTLPMTDESANSTAL
jgi:Dynamin family